MPSEKAFRDVAVFGGDGRPVLGVPNGARHFGSSRNAGNGELRRLQKALRSGSIAKVIILARWNGHSATHVVLKLCRRLGIPLEVLA